MNFKITVETGDLAGIEAIIDRLHALSQAGNVTDKTLTTSTSELIEGAQQICPPVQQVPIVQPAVQQAPTATKQYTMQELSLATRPIVEAGRQQEVVDYLHSFKKADGTPANTIMDIPVEMYGTFATGLRQMGGKI